MMVYGPGFSVLQSIRPSISWAGQSKEPDGFGETREGGNKAEGLFIKVGFSGCSKKKQEAIFDLLFL